MVPTSRVAGTLPAIRARRWLNTKHRAHDRIRHRKIEATLAASHDSQR
jgi:hypothetical protein